MIDYISGRLVELNPTEAVIDCTGIGYVLNISLQTFSAIQGKDEVKLYAYEQIREDQWTLFGFSQKEERELFRMLITVSGIGGNTARMILSAFSPSELCHVIANGEEHMLKGIKGIGLKTAQRIIVELKDKLKDTPWMDNNTDNTETNSISREKQEEAVAALSMLGFSPAASKRVVIKILEKDAQLPVEQVVKQALKML